MRYGLLVLTLTTATALAPIRLAALAQGKQTSSTAPAFEVASIKVNNSGSENFGFSAKPGGVVIATNVTIRQIVRYAYSMQHSKVEGGPDWLDTVRYDITAKAAEAAPSDQMTLMFRPLLADRFKLAMHIEARDTAIFALVRARSDGRLGPQLRVSSVTDCDATRAAQARGAALAAGDGRPICAGRAQAGSIIAGAVSMDELARNTSRMVGRVVVDRTGLPGRYDLDLKFTPEADLTAAPPPNRPPDALPSFFVALEEQLGLKLEPQRGPVDVVVIDSIQRPTED
jgi:uncharacterized protein (TIGR03435 family)